MTTTLSRGADQRTVGGRVVDGRDVDDLEAVYRQYSPQCYALALRLVRDRDLAADVVQNVFENLARHPGRFEPARGSLSTWLMTLTHHKAVDLIRWQHKRAGRDVEDRPDVDIVDLTPGPEQAAVTNHDRARVITALHQLSDLERQVLVLAYFGGHSQTDIARQLNRPIGTVKSQTARALRRMHHHLGQS